jgi:hypothetical protein
MLRTEIGLGKGYSICFNALSDGEINKLRKNYLEYPE